MTMPGRYHPMSGRCHPAAGGRRVAEPDVDDRDGEGDGGQGCADSDEYDLPAGHAGLGDDVGGSGRRPGLAVGEAVVAWRRRPVRPPEQSRGRAGFQ